MLRRYWAEQVSAYDPSTDWVVTDGTDWVVTQLSEDEAIQLAGRMNRAL
jgi:hypothetical protein